MKNEIQLALAKLSLLAMLGASIIVGSFMMIEKYLR
jgi:hypothetical protein